MRGVYGFMTAMNFAFFRYLRVAKHIERRMLARHNGATGPAPDAAPAPVTQEAAARDDATGGEGQA